LRALFEAQRDEEDEIRWFWKSVEDTRVLAAIRDAKAAVLAITYDVPLLKPDTKFYRGATTARVEEQRKQKLGKATYTPAVTMPSATKSPKGGGGAGIRSTFATVSGWLVAAYIPAMPSPYASNFSGVRKLKEYDF